MRAIFIAVGSEMLELGRVDTNSSYVIEKLMERGFLVDMKLVVGDDMENLVFAIKSAYKRTQLVVITGGLGPTQDDLTREAVANALKRELEFRPEIKEQLEERFQKRGMKMPEINTRQAFIVQGADVIPNPNGTAPGLYIDEESCRILMLPGPPQEMIPMFDKMLEERLGPLCNYFIYKRTLKFGGVTESGLDSAISDLYVKYKNPRTTILASPGVIEVHLLGRSKRAVEEAKVLTDELAEKIKDRMKEALITEKDISFAEYILDELRARNLTLSAAESCTGGGLGHTLTNVPGSSEVYLGGVIAYSNELKMNILGVDPYTLTRHGAVSRETAREMAGGIRRVTGSDIGIGITGIAGPGGGTPSKPVGLVLMHLSAADAEMDAHFVLSGSREMVKARSVNSCFNLIREYLKKK
ncbi:MAG: competence/damage-inducible protein A [Candidatus Omnitrophota bacterium]